jgi:mannose-6-phosphate isomerase
LEAVIRPIRLGPNQPHDRFYRGGDQIAAFRRLAEVRPYTPEDWVASVTTLFGEKALGLTRLEHGGLLVDDIAADPVAWLGPDHVGRWGDDPCLLVKLLDAGAPFAHRGVRHNKSSGCLV